MLHYIILLLALIVIYLVQKNKVLLQEIIKISNKINDNNINMFEKRENHRLKQGVSSNTIVLDKDIVVYDDWTKELQLVIFNKSADNFPFLVTVRKDLSIDEAKELFDSLKEHYNKGGRLYDISSSKN